MTTNARPGSNNNKEEFAMQANWSLILNVLLLIGVIVAILRIIKTHRENNRPVPQTPSVGKPEKSFDEIIAVRKVAAEVPVAQPILQATSQPATEFIAPNCKPSIPLAPVSMQPESKPVLKQEAAPASIMLFLLAKENRQLVGYELLQTVLACGLRFGEGQLFHRHQHPNGQGPVLCSLAAATTTGTFDLQNIGAFTVRGLCLFMQASGNATIDAERFEIMLDTAKQLSEGLDTHLLDDKQKPLTDASIHRYHRLLNIEVLCESV